MLKPVLANGIQIGVANGQEWHDPHGSMSELSSSNNKRRLYSLRITFTARRHGTYRQSVIFGFRRCPVFLQRICVDYLPRNDYERIQMATHYQLSQIPSRCSDPVSFYSPFMPHSNPREIMLSKIYPYPSQQNFFLTQDTLSDEELTPRNYRGRMHEIITLEEIARHEQLSRYNQISKIRLLSHYILITGDSTIAKYTPPGELFAQVRSLRMFLFALPHFLFNVVQLAHVSQSESLLRSFHECMYYIRYICILYVSCILFLLLLSCIFSYISSRNFGFIANNWS